MIFCMSNIVTSPETTLSSSRSIGPALGGRLADQLRSLAVIDDVTSVVLSTDDVKRLFEASQLTVSPTAVIPLLMV